MAIKLLSQPLMPGQHGIGEHAAIGANLQKARCVPDCLAVAGPSLIASWQMLYGPARCKAMTRSESAASHKDVCKACVCLAGCTLCCAAARAHMCLLFKPLHACSLKSSKTEFTVHPRQQYAGYMLCNSMQMMTMPSLVCMWGPASICPACDGSASSRMVHRASPSVQVGQEQQRAGRAAQGDAADERAAPPQHCHVPGRLLRAALHGHRVLRAGLPARHPAARPGVPGAPKPSDALLLSCPSFSLKCLDAGLPCTASFCCVKTSL